MYVFVSWAYMDAAAKAEESRANWVHDLLEKDKDLELAAKLTTESCLPEYDAYLKTIEDMGDGGLQTDELNANLLAVRFVVPAMEKVVTYQLSKRLPGSKKLPVSLACRSFLLNNFKGEWTGDITSPKPKRLVFVGMSGLQDFLGNMAIACAAQGEPLPVDLWKLPKLIELPTADKLRKLVDACAYHQKNPAGQQKYQSLISGWMGVGTSAERDSGITLATAFRLGIRGN